MLSVAAFQPLAATQPSNLSSPRTERTSPMLWMTGNLNDKGNEAQRGLYLLTVIRGAIGRALAEDPDVDQLEELEGHFQTHMRWTRRFEAHTADEAVVAIATLAALFVRNPESSEPREDNEGTVIPRTDAKRLARLLIAAAPAAAGQR
jgi:hypothetical protein